MEISASFPARRLPTLSLTLQICADAFEGKIDPADGENQPSLTIDPIMITSENVDEYIELYTKYGLMK